MMRAGFLSLSLMMLFCFGTALPQPAFASGTQTVRKALAKQPFRDLPGVKLPQKADDEPATVCSSRIGYDYWSGAYRRGGYRPWLARRIYRCEVDNVTIESTRQPNEIDWKKQKRYYKPWIDDGFDR